MSMDARIRSGVAPPCSLPRTEDSFEPNPPLVRSARTTHRRSSLWSLLLPLALFLFVLGFSPDAHAYAWMIRHGYTACSTCHADPSGGELLTSYGRVTSDLILRMHYGEKKEEDTPSPGVLWGAWEPPEELLVSGSFRNLYIVKPSEPGSEFRFVPVMQGDLYGQLKVGGFRVGGSLGVGKVAVGSTLVRPAQITTGQGDELNLISRTHYVGYDFNNQLTLRVGRVNTPFGVRMPEHTAWVRTATRTDRESHQHHGVALAYVGEKTRAEVFGIAGNFQLGPDRFRERGYSLYVERIASSRLAAGISSKVTYAELDRLTFEPNTLRQAHGVTLRWAPFDQLAILGEVNALFRTNADAGYVGFFQADYEPIQGLHFLLTGEFVDEGLAVQTPSPVASPGFGEPRFGGWLSVDWFFYRQFEFRTDAIFRQNDPFTLLGQLHFYL